MNQQIKILAGCGAALLVLAGLLIAVFMLPKKAESIEETIPLNKNTRSEERRVGKECS